MKKFLELIFFGNIFYGICAVIMTLESSLFQGFVIDNMLFYVFIFCITILYYTQSYEIIFKLPKKNKAFKNNINKRLVWFRKNNKMIFYLQIFLLIASIISIVFYLYTIENFFTNIRVIHIVLIIVLLITAIFYYGKIMFPGKDISLRRGLIKPFIIGFVWAGVVVLMPAVMQEIIADKTVMSTLTLFSFLDYFLLVSILAIMFDIKDYEDDINADLKTYIVQLGREKSIKKIIIPLIIIYICFLIAMIIMIKQNIYFILYHTIVILLITSVVFSLFKDRKILYYLIAIDGIMLIKAGLGITVNLVN